MDAQFLEFLEGRKFKGEGYLVALEEGSHTTSMYNPLIESVERGSGSLEGRQALLCPMPVKGPVHRRVPWSPYWPLIQNPYKPTISPLQPTWPIVQMPIRKPIGPIPQAHRKAFGSRNYLHPRSTLNNIPKLLKEPKRPLLCMLSGFTYSWFNMSHGQNSQFQA